MSGPQIPLDASSISQDAQAHADPAPAPLTPVITQAPGLTNQGPAPMFGDGPAEPTRVYGYVAFVDPATGSEYIPHGLYGDPLRTDGWPLEISLAFATPGGGQVDVALRGGQYWYREAVRNPDGSVEYRAANAAGSVAWYYDIVLEQDRTAGAPDPRESSGADGRLAVVTYNPDYFRFAGVAPTIAYYGQAGPPATFTRRGGPFPDLPDTL